MEDMANGIFCQNFWVSVSNCHFPESLPPRVANVSKHYLLLLPVTNSPLFIYIYISLSLSLFLFLSSSRALIFVQHKVTMC